RAPHRASRPHSLAHSDTATRQHLIRVGGEIRDAMVTPVDHMLVCAFELRNHLAPIQQLVASCSDQEITFRPCDARYRQHFKFCQVLCLELEWFISMVLSLDAYLSSQVTRRMHRRIQQHSTATKLLSHPACVIAAQR